MTKLRTADLQEEYDHAITEGKKLAHEYETYAPDHVKERIRKAIAYAADILLMQGTPKHNIANKLLVDFEYFYSRATVYRILGAEFFDDNSSQLRPQNESLYTPNEFERTNEGLIKLADREIQFWKNIRVKCAQVHIIKPVMEHNPKVWPQHDYEVNALLDTCDECMDGRQSVPQLKQYELLIYAAVHGPAATAEMYQNEGKIVTLVPKQITKYRNGEVPNLLPLFVPKSREDAIESRYYGVQCPQKICKTCETSLPADVKTCNTVLRRKDKTGNVITKICPGTEFVNCKSWMLKIDKGGDEKFFLHCFHCLGTFAPVTEALPSRGVELDDKITKTLGNYEQWKKENHV